VPAHCLLWDRSLPGSPRLVLVIRGTKQLGDALLDASAAPVDLLGGRIHGGVLHGAVRLGDALRPILDRVMDASDTLHLTGHSLGGATAAALGLLLQAKAQDPTETTVKGPVRLRATILGCSARYVA